MMMYVLSSETPEGEDLELLGVYDTDTEARHAAEAHYRKTAADDEALVWDVNPAYGDEDLGFAGDGSSIVGYRVRTAEYFPSA